ncbi:MAG: Stp1/IreP family PP2C-type Ser/Thr phosphatase [Oscillospiraceae bacterium]
MDIIAESSIGSVRSENQDRVSTIKLGPSAAFAVVCDGMGGENAGSFASETAISVISKRIESGYRPDSGENAVKSLLMSAVRTANAVVYDLSEVDPLKKGMGTTAVAVLRRDDMIYCVNVGDSRAYLIDGGIKQITKDHTAVMQLYESGKITFEEMKTHPNRNYLTRAVGVAEHVSPDYFELSADSKSTVLLCSDGLSGVCSDEEILSAVKGCSLAELPKRLIALALERGSRDNITAAVISGPGNTDL